MANEQEIRRVLEQLDPERKISSEKIEEVVMAIKELENNPPVDGEIRDGMHFSVLEDQLKQQIQEEPDWRRRASLAAKLISLNME
jgi:hypothetical protein